MKQFLLCLLFVVFSGSLAFSQDTTRTKNKIESRSIPKAFDWNKVSIGGNLGISRYYLNIAPVAGYMLTDKLMAGAGATYISFGSPYYPQWMTIYGGKVFGRYYFVPFAFAHAELEELNGPWDPLEDQPFWINTTLVGGGYRQHIGGTFYMDMMILFNVNDNIYSPYQNPIIRMGANIGL